jgi:hypothetical protein
VKHAVFASQETECFEAVVVIDGVKALHVRNEGHGGCNFYDEIVKGSLQRLRDLAAILPKEESRHFPEGYQPDADSVVGDLFDDWSLAKILKRKMAKMLLVTKTDKGGVYEFHIPPTRERLIQIKAKFPTVNQCLNAVPLAEAVTIFKAAEAALKA